MGIIRKTRSVKLILNAFEDSRNAISVVNLVDRMSEHMNKTTVYRILERLEESGLVHSFYGKDGLKWYTKCTECTSEKHSDHQPHLQCIDCGCIERIPVQINIPNVPNVKIDSAQIVLTGTCSKCNS